MKKEIADKWVAALPNYKQAFGTLQNSEGFCCLGVLCDLAVKERVIPEPILQNGGLSGYCQKPDGFDLDVEFHHLPPAVMRWAGVRTSCGELPRGCEKASLIMMNDSSSSFEEIARTIELNWETL